MAQHQRSRIVASVAATCIALACGTNVSTLSAFLVCPLVSGPWMHLVSLTL